MSHPVPARPAIALAIGVVLAVTARADEYSDYRIPDHRLLLANAGVQATYTTDRTYSGEQRRSDAFGYFQTNGSWGRTSDARMSVFSWDAASDGDRGHDDATQFTRHDVARRAQMHEHFALSASTTADPWRVPVGYDALVLGSAGWEQRWEAAHTHDYQDATEGRYVFEYRLDSRGWFETRSVELRAGFHVGRVRDATAVAEARLLERRLLRNGVLARPLGREARRRLAQLADVADDLAAAHDRPARHVWAAVERILRDDGALRDTSGAGVLAAQEPWIGPGVDPRGLLRSPIGHDVGWSVAPYASMQHRWYASNTRYGAFHEITLDDSVLVLDQSAFDVPGNGFSDLPALGLRVEAHRPLGDAWQLGGAAYAERPVDEHRRKAFTVGSTVALSAALADRLVWSVEGSQFRQILEHRAVRFDTWSTQVRTTLQFYVEDHVALTATALSQQQHGQSQGFGSTTSARHGMLRLGIDYRLARRYRAPGLTTT